MKNFSPLALFQTGGENQHRQFFDEPLVIGIGDDVISSIKRREIGELFLWKKNYLPFYSQGPSQGLWFKIVGVWVRLQISVWHYIKKIISFF